MSTKETLKKGNWFIRRDTLMGTQQAWDHGPSKQRCLPPVPIIPFLQVPQSPASPLRILLSPYNFFPEDPPQPILSQMQLCCFPQSPLPPPSEPVLKSPQASSTSVKSLRAEAGACLEGTQAFKPALLPFTQSNEGRIDSSTEICLEKHST